MSKGNKVVPVRFTPEELQAIAEAIESANDHTRDEPYTVSSWIRKAVKDKLAHLSRSKRPRKVKQS